MIRKILPAVGALLAIGAFLFAAEPRVDVALGDPETVMVKNMRRLGAQDVTARTRFVLTEQITGEQKTYWWELPNKAIVGILLAGATKGSLVVATIEIGDPGKGIAGIEHWREQKLQMFPPARDKFLK